VAEYRDRTPMIRIRVKGPGMVKPGSANLNDVGGVADAPGSEGRMLSWSFDEKEKGACKGQLELRNFDQRFPDDPMFDRGVTVYVSWGEAGDMTEEHQLVVTDWTPGPTFIVELLDQGMTANKLPVDHTYDGLTYSGIVEKIADRMGYTYDQQDIQESGAIVESVSQNNRTDWQMLGFLANKLKWVWGITPAGLFFHERRLNQAPVLAISYFQGVDSGVRMTGFPKFDKPPAAQPGAVTLKGKDAVTKKPFEVRADDKSTAGRPGIADTLEVWDKATGDETLRAKVASEIVAPTTVGTKAEAETKAKGLFKASTGNPVKCDVTITGEAKLRTKVVVELRGIGRRLSGNYYVSEIKHEVKPGIFSQVLKCRRDGTNGIGGAIPAPESAAKTNGQKGPAAMKSAPVLVEGFDVQTAEARLFYKDP
jgi:phage protein D